MTDNKILKNINKIRAVTTGGGALGGVTTPIFMDNVFQVIFNKFQVNLMHSLAVNRKIILLMNAKIIQAQA